MRKLTLELMLRWFLPKGPPEAYLEAARKAKLGEVGKLALLALATFVLLESGVVVYAVWLLTAAIVAAYQYFFVFSYPVTRPVLYEETSLILACLVLASHLALATLCGVGWVGAALVTVSFFYLGKTVGRFAIARELRRMMFAVREDYPEEPFENQVRLAQELLEIRVGDVNSL